MPAEEIFGFVRIGDEFRRVAGAPLHFSDWDSASTHAFDGRNHLANGMTTPRAKVNGSILVAPKHVPEARNVRLGQVHYMGIVADGSAVRCGVIRPVNLECRLLPLRCLNCEWNQMSFRRVALSELTVRVGAGRVEVTQGCPVQFIRLPVPSEDAFDHPL